MDKTKAILDPSTIKIADPVRFAYHGQAVRGVVAKKSRSYAHIVCDDRRELRVPYQRLEKLADGAPAQTPSLSEPHRLTFNAGDRVQFALRGRALQGVVVRTNPKRGHIAAEDGKEYHVSYKALQRLEEPAGSTTVARSQAQIEAIIQLARSLMSHHQLAHWGFQVDNGTKRAGSCQYGTQSITLAYEFAKRAPAEVIRETLLHEIAHALVGRTHHHDDVWRAKAVEIGGSGRRCHEL